MLKANQRLQRQSRDLKVNKRGGVQLLREKSETSRCWSRSKRARAYAANAGQTLLAAAARMAKAVIEDSGEVMPVCAWVDGEYGISGVYLGVEAEIGRTGVKKVVEGTLTDTEVAALKEAAEAVRAKQADVQTL